MVLYHIQDEERQRNWRKNNMCLICVDYQKGKLTVSEAWRNLQEMQEVLDSDHVDVVLSTLFFGEQYEKEGQQPIIDYSQLIEDED